MEAFILKYITKQRSGHYCTRRFQLPQIHVLHSQLDQATFTFLHILKHVWDFYKKGICNHLLPLFIQINFPSWSMNHKNWLMNQKKSVNSIEPKGETSLSLPEIKTTA